MFLNKCYIKGPKFDLHWSVVHAYRIPKLMRPEITGNFHIFLSQKNVEHQIEKLSRESIA